MYNYTVLHEFLSEVAKYSATSHMVSCIRNDRMLVETICIFHFKIKNCVRILTYCTLICTFLSISSCVYTMVKD